MENNTTSSSSETGRRNSKKNVNITSILTKVVIVVGIILVAQTCSNTVKSLSKPDTVKETIVNHRTVVVSDTPYLYEIWRNQGNLVIDTHDASVLISVKTRDGKWSEYRSYNSTGGKAFPFSGSNVVALQVLSNSKTKQQNTTITLKQKK